MMRKKIIFLSLSLVFMMTSFSYADERSESGCKACKEVCIESLSSLMAQARNEDPEAYNKLAEYYRYGKGGAEKSVMNAMIFYDKAGLDLATLFKEAYSADPHDEFGLINHIMEGMARRQLTSADIIAELNRQPKPMSEALNLLERVMKNEESYLQQPDSIISLLNEKSTPDEFLVAIGLTTLFDEEPKDLVDYINIPEYRNMIVAMAEKIPYINNTIGGFYFFKYNEAPASNAEYFDKAVENWYQADRYGLLDDAAIDALISYCKSKNVDNIGSFNAEDISRLTDRYNKYLEEEAENCPVMEIEEE